MSGVVFASCLRSYKKIYRLNQPLLKYLDSQNKVRQFTIGSEPEIKDNNINSETSKEEVKIESDSTLNVEKDKSDLKLKLQELEDKYKRSLAETENVRQRMQRQIADAKLFGIQVFCKDLLEVADILNKATESVPPEQLKQNESLSSLFDGLRMTKTQLEKVFSKHGLAIIDPPIGEKFNPNFHEALFQLPRSESSDCVAGGIAAVSKQGYKLHDRTIRPALVGVYQ